MCLSAGGGPARSEHSVSSMEEAGLADLGWQGSTENQGQRGGLGVTLEMQGAQGTVGNAKGLPS